MIDSKLASKESTAIPIEVEADLSSGQTTIPIVLSIKVGRTETRMGSNQSIQAKTLEEVFRRDSREGREGRDSDLESPHIDADYDTREGYDPTFLSSGTMVPLPKLTGTMATDVAINQQAKAGKPKFVLPYHHFSVVQNKNRRLAFFTAVNIDGKAFKPIKREADRWSYDPRIDQTEQVGAELYDNNDFDKGHLVRRQDPSWGRNQQEALEANDDTFHYTNCSPQHKSFNQGKQLWAGLEDYILKNATNSQQKVCLFNGPVFRDDDPEYREIQIPLQFWKVAVILKDDGQFSATAYIISQADLVPSVLSAEEDVFVYGKFKTFQVPVQKIETLTGLNFGQIANFDPLASQATETVTEGHTIQPMRQLHSVQDIVL